ncbi:hypothetical protein L0156_00775 [bacterium]|nr:hypothetical protein [bacterium]
MKYKYLLTLFIFSLTYSFAGNFYDPDTPESGSIEAIKSETTDPRYGSPWVSYVPESTSVPSPSDFLGHIAGAAGKFTNSKQIYGYMRKLDDSSERVHVEVIGKTEEGREILLVAIADEAGIRDLQNLKNASAALADPRKTSPEQAEAIIQKARPFYFLNAAIHADESISPDMSLELVYRLAVSDQPMIQNIREKVVVLINPISNPDGRDKLSEWFYQHIAGKTEYDTLPRQSPPYWGKYVYVDGNRDAHQLTMGATQAVARAFFEYHPVVVHDLHEAIPFLQTWNGTGPYNPHLDPIVLSEFLEMSFHEMNAMSSHGMPGVWTWNFGEGFGHHYMDSVGMNHNAIGRGYETFGNAVPLTLTRKLDPSDMTREWYRPFPPQEKTFLWSHRNGVNYAQTGCLAILDYSARHAEELLRNFYKKSFNSWQKGKSGNPYAFVIPAEQQDRRRVAGLVNRLRAQGIEVGRANKNFQIKEGSFPAGSFVVRLDQPYRNYAVDLLLPQEFPKNAEYEPYDDISWALPINFGVKTIRVDDGAIQQVQTQLLAQDVHPSGSVRGTGSTYILNDSGQEALLSARYRLSRFKIEIAEKSFRSGSSEYPAGSWIIAEQSGIRSALEEVSEELALDFDSVASAPDVPRHDAAVPRLGVWVPWADTDMIGWIRYILDSQKIPYTYIRDDDIKNGQLKKLVDVIAYGNVLLDLQAQIHGIDQTKGPLPFKKTEKYPSLGTPAESDDITGGIGWKGLAHLQQFVEEGGLFITLGSGSTLALESGFVRFVKRADLQGVTTPGAHIGVKFLQPEHPIAYGYPTVTYALRSNFPIYDPPRRWTTMSYCMACLNGPYDFQHVVLQWGTTAYESGETASPIVISGGGKNPEALEGRPAILDMPVGKGHVLVFNFNPMHRDMNRGDHRYLWNGILNWKYILSR